MGLWKTHSVIGTKASGLSLTKPNRFCQHDQPTTLHTLVVSRRFVKKQQMGWTLRGAHLLLQTRTKVLNDELEDVFRRRYPQFRAKAT
jgi:hypothetical protein